MRERDGVKCQTRTGTAGRRRAVAFATGALLLGVLSAAPRPAHALDPATVTAAIGFIKQAYSAYQTLKGLLATSGSTGPTLADIANQLNAVQSAIIADMRSQRNLALQSRTRTVFTLFRDISDNSPKDPTNASAWSTLRFEQQAVADAMFDIIMYQNDVTSSYQLAPAYNSVLTTGTGVIRIKGQIWPSTPSSWNDHYIWLQPGMAANYKMVGSRKHECWPGHNPGYRPSSSSLVTGKYRDSQLYTKKLGNKWFTTMTFWCGAEQCNDGIKQCFTSTVGCSGGGSSSVVTYGCSTARGLACAAELAKPTFDGDPIVKIVREGMVGIQKLSGGSDYNWASNDPLMANGQFVDPWVDEPSCTNGPWAYPQVP